MCATTFIFLINSLMTERESKYFLRGSVYLMVATIMRKLCEVEASGFEFNL